MKSKYFLIAVSFFLFLMPFFWFKPNEMDLGGDSSRLYFYDPVSYTQNTFLYVLLPAGNGYIDSGVFSGLPQMALLIALKSIFHSPYILITIFNILKVLIGFLAVYAIVKELLNSEQDKSSHTTIEFVAILSGLFYIFSRHLVSNYDMALLYHNQVFLNPLIAYLLLKYFLTHNSKYGWFTLFVSFIFASNFSYLASPPLFAFYPLVILFLLLYVKFIRQKKLPLKGILFGLFLFLGLHAFHIIPVVGDILYTGSHTNTRLFNKESLDEQIGVFFGVLQTSSIQRTLFLPSWHEKLRAFSIIFPAIILLGFYLNKKKERAVLLIGIFFLITFFLVTAKIAQAGIDLYSKLFLIPGFSLFRNFTGIWTYVYTFFYALLFGHALFYVFKKIPPFFVKYVFIIIGAIIILSAWPFIDGSFVNKVHYQSKNVKAAIVMDPLYEKMLVFIKSLPQDSKLLTLPFSDYNFQVLPGLNNGAYIGPSTLPYLVGKGDFPGYGMAAPYSDLFFQFAKDKNYEKFRQMLGLLNIQYVFYNDDPRILDKFPIYPFSPDYVRKFFPNDQKGYREFVKDLTSKKIFSESTYELYSLGGKYFLPHFYIPKKIYLYENDPHVNQYYNKASSFFPSSNDDYGDPRVVFLDKELCKMPTLEAPCNNSSDALHMPDIFFEKINPTKYRIRIKNVNKPFILVFSEIFNRNWKLIDSTRVSSDYASGVLGNIEKNVVGKVTSNANRSDIAILSYFDGQISEGKHMNIFLEPNTFETWGKEEIANNTHFEVNGFANAWYIKPEDMQGKKEYELILELTSQRVIYAVLPISLAFFATCLFYSILLYNKSLHRRNSS